MSTDISMQTRAYQVDDRRWLLAEPDVKLNRTLDTSTFVAGTHYPNGYLPSGTVIAKITATGLYGPYDSTASDGRQLAADSLTYGTATFIRQDGSLAPKVGISGVVNDTIVSAGKLPFQTGAGSATAAAKTTLAQIRWEA